MKKLIFTFGLGLLTAEAAWADEQKVRIEVSGLYCPSCKYIAGEAMQMVESVEILDAVVAEDGETAVYIVSYDDAVTDPKEIAEWTLMFGYPSQVLTGDGTSS